MNWLLVYIKANNFRLLMKPQNSDFSSDELTPAFSLAHGWAYSIGRHRPLLVSVVHWANWSSISFGASMVDATSVLHSVPWPMDPTSYQTKVDIIMSPHRRGGGQIVFGADPVGVSWTGGWILTKFACMKHWDMMNSWLGFGDLDLIFKVTANLSQKVLVCTISHELLGRFQPDLQWI